MKKAILCLIVMCMMLSVLSQGVFAYPVEGASCTIPGRNHTGISAQTYDHEDHGGVYTSHCLVYTTQCIYCYQTIERHYSTHCKPNQCFYYSIA